jgi:hypothetical protein
MHVELDEGSGTDAAEAVDLTGLDDQNVTCFGFEFLSVDGPETAAFPHELDLIVWMTVGSRATPGKCAEEEYGDTHVPVLGPDELVRAALKGQVLLANAVHRVRLLWRGDRQGRANTAPCGSAGPVRPCGHCSRPK